MQAFMNQWLTTLDGMRSPPDPEIKLDHFEKQLRQSEVLKHDIGVNDRADIGHPDHTYEFLERSVLRYLTRVQLRKNREAQERDAKKKADAKGKVVDKKAAGGHTKVAQNMKADAVMADAADKKTNGAKEKGEKDDEAVPLPLHLRFLGMWK